MKLRIRHEAVTVWTTLSVVGPRLGRLRRPAAGGLLAIAVATQVNACGQKPLPSTAAGPSSIHSRATSIMVFAALQLKPAFTLLAGQFQTENPGTTVDFNFASSAELANKLTRGAKADVFASADAAQMDTVIKADLTSSEPVNFASNTLVIVTAPDDPKQVRSFADLARPDLRVAVCQASAPCGAGVQRIEDNTGVHIDPVSEETIGSAVLAKVTAGEADAGLVYMNDAHKAGDKVASITFPESADAVNSYPIVALKQAAESVLAQKFVDLVVGATGQRVLSQAGFAGP
ncbi:molybdate ABC transporter substrate-binding protein [Candidatus Mycobacterium wuenschmannii]|uniref:Molybdate ABC transporter substrate-binding protein n=1 Tax=Candidatus Mycobacterium wuenschmannii TaxID=3027808 RepID=A0ABY8VZA7_9MYCO|nr:molybdate ABC transporter substrate-binding protein [Candidatus Mycobacterium wuenschmannii]WIM88983.1 molybdate ABC transporter substrate-binding protein [Candidatus Mycobacterium wuenschmannii]